VNNLEIANILSGDIIVAPATPKGRSAIAGVRISGDGCHDFVWRALQLKPKPAEFEANRAYVVYFSIEPHGAKSISDRAVAIVYKSPKSYTGEDMVELFVHGNPILVEAIISLLTSLGARLAYPGEFTLRAVMNGKMDLIQAESVAATVSAQTLAAVASARNAAQKSRELKELWQKLHEILVEVVAALEFPEDEVPMTSERKWLTSLRGVKEKLESYLSRARSSRVLSEGFTVAISGAPNVGKSTLFNCIVGAEKAIVTPHPGTTRDIIEATIELDGVPVKIMDTAGIRETAHPVEHEGIRRAKNALSTADLVLWLVEANSESPQPPPKKDFVVVVNKVDLGVSEKVKKLYPNAVQTIAKDCQGIDDVINVIKNAIVKVPSDSLLFSLRTQERLDAAYTALCDALDALDKGFLDVAEVELDRADAILGEFFQPKGARDIYEEVFAKFCIGK